MDDGSVHVGTPPAHSFRVLRRLGERPLLAVMFVIAIGGSIGWVLVSAMLARSTPAPRLIEQADGRLLAETHVTLENLEPEPCHYTITIAEPRDAVVRSTQVRWKLGAKETRVVPLSIELASSTPPRSIYLRIDSEHGVQRIAKVDIGGASR